MMQLWPRFHAYLTDCSISKQPRSFTWNREVAENRERDKRQIPQGGTEWVGSQPDGEKSEIEEATLKISSLKYIPEFQHGQSVQAVLYPPK